MTTEKALSYRLDLEKYENAKGSTISGNERHKSQLLFSWVNEIVNNKKILDSIEDILGPNILCWSSNFFIKEATKEAAESITRKTANKILNPSTSKAIPIGFRSSNPAIL